MPTLAELAVLDHREWRLVFVIEDLPVAFTDDDALVGTMDGREVLAGLTPPDYTLAIDTGADWMLARSPVDIRITDFDGVLGQYFGRAFDGTEAQLVFSVEPGDDLSGLTELHDRHVGTEFIGPAGERNYYPLDGVARPRFHAGTDIQGGDNGVASVSASVRVLDGRRCALYQHWVDHTGSTPVLVSPGRRVWWGTLRSTTMDPQIREWRLKCDGPDSWLYRRLGSISQATPVTATPRPYFPPDIDNGFVTLRSFASDLSGEETYASGYVFSLPTGETSRSEVIEAVLAGIDAAKAVSGADGVFVDEYSQDVNIGAGGGIAIRIADFSPPSERLSVMRLTMPLLAWITIGYNPLIQRELAYSDEKWVHFVHQGLDAWTGVFTTVKEPYRTEPSDDDVDNGSEWRVWLPLYPYGAISLSNKPADDEVLLRLGYDAVVASGQFDQPIASDPTDPTAAIDVDGSPASAQGYWLVYGPRRFADSDEIITEYQVFRCAWAQLSGYQVGGDQPTLRIVGVEDPRAFGFNRPPMTTPWAMPIADPGGGLKAVPIMRLGYGTPDMAGENADALLARMMFGQGAVDGWSSFADDPTTEIEIGANDPGWSVPVDSEIPDLGLAIPQASIADPATWGLMDALPGGSFRKASVNFVGGMQSETIIRSLMAPRGWAMGLEGGVYRPFVYDQLVESTETIVLDMSTKRVDSQQGKLQHRVSQVLNALAPKDEYAISYDQDPLTKANQHALSIPSPDPGRPYRSTREDRGKSAGGRVHSATTASFDAPFQRIVGDWYVRARELALWTSLGHFWVHGYPLMPQDAEMIWPGQRVTLTDPSLYDPVSASYGVVAAQGIVTKVMVKAGGRSVTCEIFVDGRSLVQGRYHAPMAQARGYDPVTRRLYVDDDCMNNGTGILDCQYFVEPPGINLGGAARLQVHQYDGVDWTVTCTGVVEDVDATPGSSSIRIVGGLSGTYRRDDEAIVTLQPFTDQDAAWVLTLHAPVSDQDGVWTDGTVVAWSS
jgi:hypothetical protein